MKTFKKRFPVLIALVCSSISLAATHQSKDVDLSILDKKVDPCVDFYQYACGGWLAKTAIPSDRPMWNRSFSTIDLNNRTILNKILKDYAAGKKAPANPYAELLGNFYAACMDEATIEAQGLAQFKTELSELDKLTEVRQLASVVAKLHRQGSEPFFGFGEEQDAKDSTQVIGVVDQGGLGLPDRDYYVNPDAKMEKIRALYREHVAKMFVLLKEPNPTQAADVVMKIETALAKVSMSRVDRRDPNNVYHRLERAGLLERAPLFDWAVYFNELDPNTTPKLTALNVAVPDFFTGLNQVLKDIPLSELKAYIKWHMLTSVTEALPKKFVDEHFHFVSTALSGQKTLEPRWKRCVRAADRGVGFALGRSFVEVAYGKEGKDKSQAMIQEIESQFHLNLAALSWMDEKTKEQAQRKLSKMNNKIGYPKVWRSYDGLKADRKSFLKTLENAAVFNTEYELNKIGKPVDPNEWGMTPSAVNAYYDPQRNEIVFPAGILQYPFFNRESPDSLNYGAIGVVMGHELTHGFDDEGRQFDADGNLKNWWSKEVLEKFEARTGCVEKEYGMFEALPGLLVNGKLTLGENIADQGGMKLAYRSWKARQGSEPVATGKPTAEQKFFLAFAQSWCQKEQEQYSRMRVTVDPHSPSHFRVDGVVSQFAPFARAFGCAPGSKMAPALQCDVW